MNSENRRVVRDVFVLQDMNAAIFNVVIRDLGNGSRIGDAGYEQQCRQNHSGFNGDREIGKHGQANGH